MANHSTRRGAGQRFAIGKQTNTRVCYLNRLSGGAVRKVGKGMENIIEESKKSHEDINNGKRTLNEVRKKRGYPPIAGGDSHYIALDVKKERCYNHQSY